MLTNSYQTSFRSGKSLMDGTVLMDLFKAFDCIPHGLLVSKPYVYGLFIDATTFSYSF